MQIMKEKIAPKSAAARNDSCGDRPLLRCAPSFHRSGGRSFLGNFSFRIGRFKAAQNFVCGVLQPCIRLVELAGCLARQLAELVAILNLRKRFKNKIGTHCVSPSISIACPEAPVLGHPPGGGQPIQTRTTPNCCFHLLDAHPEPKVQKLLGPLHAMKWTPCHIGYTVCASEKSGCLWAIQGACDTHPTASTEPVLKGMMLKMADGHYRPQCATCPLWMASMRV